MNNIWNIVEPYILTIIGVICGGSVVGIVARIICSRLIDKASTAYNLNEFAAKVADKLGGKTLNVDMTAIVEKKLREISDILSAQVKAVADETNSYKHLLALIGEALAHLKMLTDEERTELIKAVQELDSEYKPPEKEVIATVKLEPITVTESLAQEKSNVVNFG